MLLRERVRTDAQAGGGVEAVVPTRLSRSTRARSRTRTTDPVRVVHFEDSKMTRRAGGGLIGMRMTCLSTSMVPPIHIVLPGPSRAVLVLGVFAAEFSR